MPLTAKQLYKIQTDRQKRKISIFEKILQRVFHRIESIAPYEIFYCIFEIPQLIPGMPRFDVTACMYYVKDKLEQGGFKVWPYSATSLYISWLQDPKELEDSYKKQNSQPVKRIQFKDSVSDLKRKQKNKDFRPVSDFSRTGGFLGENIYDLTRKD